MKTQIINWVHEYELFLFIIPSITYFILALIFTGIFLIKGDIIFWNKAKNLYSISIPIISFMFTVVVCVFYPFYLLAIFCRNIDDFIYVKYSKKT